MKEIRNLMRNLSDLHYKFVKNNYELSNLDLASVKRLIEELNLEILLSEKNTPIQKEDFVNQQQTEVIQPTVFSDVPKEVVEQNEIISEVVVPSVESKTEEITVDDLNQEMNEIFFPEPTPAEINIEQVKPEPISTFQLGINERIMFAREIFDNDVSELQKSIRELQSFKNKNEAIVFFEKQFYPFMINQGKDEEILKEYEQIIERLY